MPGCIGAACISKILHGAKTTEQKMVERRRRRRKKKESKMEADVCRARSRGDCLDVPQRQSCRQCRGPSYRVTVLHIATPKLFRIYLLSPCFHKPCFLYRSLVPARHYVPHFSPFLSARTYKKIREIRHVSLITDFINGRCRQPI